MRAGHPSSGKKKIQKDNIIYFKREGRENILGDLVNKKICIITYLLDWGFFLHFFHKIYITICHITVFKDTVALIIFSMLCNHQCLVNFW